MEENPQIGSVTFLINISRSINHLFGERERTLLANRLVDLFEIQLQEKGLDDTIEVAKSEWRSGCVIETISIGIAAGGAYKLLKDYEQIRSGTIKMCEDISKLWYFLMRSQDGADNEDRLEVELQKYKNVEDKYKKYHMSNKIIFEKANSEGSKERTTKHSIALMRKDMDTSKDEIKRLVEE